MEKIKKITRVGITGQSGFIGSHLYQKIINLQGFEAVNFEDSSFRTKKKLQDFVEKCDVIVHLAGMSRGDDTELYKTNLELTHKLLDALDQTKSKAKLIFASSTHEKKSSAFGRSKKESRLIFEQWAKKNKTQFYGLIIPHVFGPGAKPYHNSATSTFCYQLTHNETPQITLNSELNLIYIDNLVEKMIEIMGKEHFTPKIIIKPDQDIMVSDVLKKLTLFKKSYLDKNIKPVFKDEFDTNLFQTLASYIKTNDQNQTETKKRKKLKIATIVGTRPEIIRLSRVMSELDRHFEHVIVHTGQNYDYELNEIFFKELNLRKPDFFLNAAETNAAATIGNIIRLSDEFFEKEKPDAILLYGDTNSCLAVISAKRRKIPVFHMEAGNRAFDQRVPEDINRKIVDHSSDINMPLTEHARRHLLAEGIKPETIIKTGSPMKEILDFYMPKIKASQVLTKLKLAKNKYFVVSAHREENIDDPDNFLNLLDSLNAVARKYKMPVIVSTHPRTRLKIEQLKGKDFNPKIRFLKPLGMFDYVKLQQNAFCVLSDSGTLSEESSILNFHGVMIRQMHERPEGMDEGTVIMAGLNPIRVLQSIEMITTGFSQNKRRTKIVNDYDVDNVSLKVVRIIQSYTDYINRTVWHKKDL